MRNDAVRRNLLSFVTSLQLVHLSLCLAVTFLLPQLLAIVLTLSLHPSPSSPCTSLWWWCVGYGVRVSLSLLISLLPFLPSSPPIPFLSSLLTSDLTSELLQLFSFLFFILGNYLLFHSPTCASTSPPLYHLVTTLLLFNCALIFLPLFLFLLCCPLFYLCTPLLLRLLNVLTELAREQRGLSPQALLHLPSVTYPPPPPHTTSHSVDTGAGCRAEGDVAVMPVECSICLVLFARGDKCRVLPCHPSHVFHVDCCDSWLRVNAVCPLCRTPILHAGEDDDDDEGQMMV